MILEQAFAARYQQNKCYSLRAFARDLGVSASDLSRFLRGKSVPGPKSVAKMLQGLAGCKAVQVKFLDAILEHHRQQILKIAREQGNPNLDL